MTSTVEGRLLQPGVHLKLVILLFSLLSSFQTRTLFYYDDFLSNPLPRCLYPWHYWPHFGLSSSRWARNCRWSNKNLMHYSYGPVSRKPKWHNLWNVLVPQVSRGYGYNFPHNVANAIVKVGCARYRLELSGEDINGGERPMSIDTRGRDVILVANLSLTVPASAPGGVRPL